MDSVKMIVGKRLAFGLLTVIVVSVLIFLGVEALPGDLAEAVLGQQATPEAVAAFRRELKLDLPPHVRYFRWLGDFMRGDLGMSLANQRPIAQMIGWRLSNTLFLAVTAAMIAVPLSLVLGILAALYRNSWFDKTISISTLSAISFPEFAVLRRARCSRALPSILTALSYRCQPPPTRILPIIVPYSLTSTAFPSLRTSCRTR